MLAPAQGLWPKETRPRSGGGAGPLPHQGPGKSVVCGFRGSLLQSGGCRLCFTFYLVNCSALCSSQDFNKSC